MSAALFRTVRRVLLLALFLAGCSTLAAGESVNIDLPVSVNFYVGNISQSTSGGTTTITYSDASLLSGNRLRISLQAGSVDFTAPAGTAIPAVRISWTGGTPGTLSALSFTEAYLSAPDPTSGSFDLTWHLSAISDLTGLRAGNQTLVATWKIEAL